MAITRRSLLVGAAGAVVAGPLLFDQLSRAQSGSTVPAEPVGFQRGVAVGPRGLRDEQRYIKSRRFFAETGTAWLRVWADWPTLQPEGTSVIDWSTLDRDIARARADGLKVMLTSYRFAGWANGTAGLPVERDIDYYLEDRLRKGAEPTARKQLSFRIPDSLAVDSPWGWWINGLVERYRRGGAAGDAWVDAIEIVNEPNLQMWPQQSRSGGRDVFGDGEPTLHQPIAQMIANAREIFDRYDTAPLLVAPATSDRVGGGRLDTGFEEFQVALLDELDRIGFKADARTAWSHHSYADVEGDTGERAARARELLVGRWSGWPYGDAANPGLMITESGARLSTIAKREKVADPGAMRARQAELLERNIRRLANGPEGAGIHLFMNYLFVTDANYDCGLCDLDGTPRPAYRAWAELPTIR